MKELKNNNAKKYAVQFLNSRAYDLWDVYNSCSYVKRRSFENIKERMHNEGGSDIRILSHNCNFYTCAYVLNNDLIVDTYCNTYIIKNFTDYLVEYI